MHSHFTSRPNYHWNRHLEEATRYRSSLHPIWLSNVGPLATATCLVFLINAAIAIFIDQRHDSLRSVIFRKGFLVAAVTSIIAEAGIGCLGSVILFGQAFPPSTLCDAIYRNSDYYNDSGNHCIYNLMRIYSIDLMVSTLKFFTLLIFPLWYFSAKKCCGSDWNRRRVTDLGTLSAWLWVLRGFTITSHVFSWLLCVKILMALPRSSTVLKKRELSILLTIVYLLYWVCGGMGWARRFVGEQMFWW